MPNYKHPRLTKSKFRLLYVGNDLKLVASLRRALTEPDYRLVTCTDRETATLFLKSEIPYDLMLIDLERQEEEGLKLAQFAHSLPHRERMPIVLVAATRLSSKLIPEGVNECATKTPNMTAVIKAIRKLTATPSRDV